MCRATLPFDDWTKYVGLKYSSRFKICSGRPFCDMDQLWSFDMIKCRIIFGDNRVIWYWMNIDASKIVYSDGTSMLIQSFISGVLPLTFCKSVSPDNTVWWHWTLWRKLPVVSVRRTLLGCWVTEDTTGMSVIWIVYPCLQCYGIHWFRFGCKDDQILQMVNDIKGKISLHVQNPRQ